MAEVRWAARGDAPKVYPLFRDLMLAEGREPLRPAAFSRMWGRVFREGSRTRFAVAEEQRLVVGCMTLHAHFSTWSDAPVVSLEDLLVAEERRGRGVGSAMLAFAEGHARELGAARVELHVRRDNARAQQLYKRTGYEEQPYVWMHKEVARREGPAPAPARAAERPRSRRRRGARR